MIAAVNQEVIHDGNRVVVDTELRRLALELTKTFTC